MLRRARGGKQRVHFARDAAHDLLAELVGEVCDFVARCDYLRNMNREPCQSDGEKSDDNDGDAKAAPRHEVAVRLA